MTHPCAKFGENRMNSNEMAAGQVKFKMAVAAILEFKSTSGFASVRWGMWPWVYDSNFIKIGQYLAKLQHFFGNPRWPPPPSWFVCITFCWCFSEGALLDASLCKIWWKSDEKQWNGSQKSKNQDGGHLGNVADFRFYFQLLGNAIVDLRFKFHQNRSIFDWVIPFCRNSKWPPPPSCFSSYSTGSHFPRRKWGILHPVKVSSRSANKWLNYGSFFSFSILLGNP